jgi:hypothetical protein
VGIAGCRWYLPINGTRGSKATSAEYSESKF